MQHERRLVIPVAKLLAQTDDGYMQAFTILVCFCLSSPVYQQLAWKLTLLFLIERIIYQHFPTIGALPLRATDVGISRVVLGLHYQP